MESRLSISFFGCEDNIKKAMSFFTIEGKDNTLYFNINTTTLIRRDVHGRLGDTNISICVQPEDFVKIDIGYEASVDNEFSIDFCNFGEGGEIDGIAEYLSKECQCEAVTFKSIYNNGESAWVETEYYLGKLYRWRDGKNSYLDIEEDGPLYNCSPWYSQSDGIVIDQSPGHYDNPDEWNKYVKEILSDKNIDKWIRKKYK